MTGAPAESDARHPSISVVIPAHNHAGFLPEAVASALGQGTCVGEVVVVDDGSTDSTPTVLAGMTDPRIRSLRLAGEGPSAARNAGWRASRGDWVFFLDADDAVAPGALERLLRAGVGDGGRVLPYGFAEVFSQDFAGEPAFTSHLSRRSGSLLRDIAVNFQTTLFVALFPRACLEGTGGYDPAVRYGEDFDFALRVARRWAFRFADIPVYRIRMHGANRHRSFPSAACDEYCATARRVLGGGWSLRERVLARRAVAHWLWVSAHGWEVTGDRVRARATYRRALGAWPLHRGALAGWRRTRG